MAFNNDIADEYNPIFTLPPEEELQFAKFLMNCVADAVFWLEPDARFFYVNDWACRLLGYSREELLSLTMHDVALGLPAEVWSDQWRSLKQHGSLTFESQYRTKAGRILSLEIAFIYGSYHGREFGCVFAREKTTEVELRSSLEQEKKSSQLRAQFICMLSHEIRTSLNLVSFSTSLLKRHSQQWTEDKKRPHLDGIQSVVEQIEHLLDDVLLIGKAEAGKLNFEPIPLDLHQFCCDLVAQMQLMSNISQHSITFVSQGNCKVANIDKKLLQPILTNLLNNAIKYSPSSSTVDLELCCRDGNVIFQIKDAGIGIPAADRQRLFEPFHRGSNVGDVPGTGVGLAVVKKLVDLHGGQIAVVNEVGGTTFTVTLPLLSQ